MIELHQVFGVPTIFIRYNPDKYVDALGDTVPAQNSRDEKCVEYLRRIIARANDTQVAQGLYVAYMYYDGAHSDNGSTPSVDTFQYDYVSQQVKHINEI